MAKQQRKTKPSLTLESRENQLIALATNLAEQRILDGTASDSLIIQYIKRGSSKEQIEKEILERQKDLITAKTESLKSAKRIEELYKNALDAMRNYSGQGNMYEEDEPDDY